jgi:hypothetical protein
MRWNAIVKFGVWLRTEENLRMFRDLGDINTEKTLFPSKISEH